MINVQNIKSIIAFVVIGNTENITPTQSLIKYGEWCKDNKFPCLCGMIPKKATNKFRRCMCIKSRKNITLKKTTDHKVREI